MCMSENDLFNYSFCPGKLSEEKIEEIKNNVEYISSIDFFNTLKIDLNRDVEYETKIKLSNIIPDYKMESNKIAN